jgi:hypothetical protein
MIVEGLLKSMRLTIFLFFEGSRSDNDSNDPTKGFAHVVNGAKKGFVPREGSGQKH